jgi:FAD/FMN-containing dehydrogenase
MATTQPTENDLSVALAGIVGGEYVLDGPEDRAYFSQDIFSFSDGPVADIVAQPGTIAELQAVLNYAANTGYAVYTRGGGMSYTHGYVPTEAPSILIDLRRINSVREVNQTEQYVVAEAGCTWIQVTEALEGTGLQLDFTAPFSGIYSTVGGAMSQNVPQGMRGILGLEVVKVDGTLLRTGSWGTKAGRPFFADFGPNLTGLFLGDCGSFAIKTAAILKLRRQPAATDYCSFAFESYEDMTRAMVSLSGMAFIRRSVGLDPYKSQNSIKVGFREALETVKAVATTQGTVAGAKFSAQATRNFMEGVKWSMHLTIDSDCAEGVAQNIEKVRAVCLPVGREIPNLLPQAMAARGFSVRGFLGPKGERWVPTNSLFPVSQAPEVATRVQAFFESHREAMNAAGMWESYMTNFGAGYFLCEPSVYWRDEVSSLHLAHLNADEARRFKKNTPNPQARQLARRIRGELKDLLQSLGAVHVQLGKYYGYGENLEPNLWEQMQALKKLFDPNYRLNPGNLGFTSTDGATQ